VNRETKTCYVELLDDEEEVCRLEDKDFVEVVRTCINGELINSESFGKIFVQGINNIVNDKYGFQAVACSDEDPLDILFINLRWLGNWFLNWTGTQEEDIYKMQTKEMFSMFISSVPERADWYSNKYQTKDDTFNEVHNKKEISQSQEHSLYKNEALNVNSKKENIILSNDIEEYETNRQNAILKYRIQEQLKTKKDLAPPIEEQVFDKRKAIQKLRNENKEDNLYDDSDDDCISETEN
jgi:hypothetical protein